MSFQSSVLAQIGAGVIGELAFDGPFRGQPAIVHSADAANNVVGRAFTITSGATGSWQAGSAGAANPAAIKVAAGGAGVFAGILANPKVYALVGTAVGGPLAPSLAVPNDIAVELVTEGDIFVALGAASAPGDVVWYLEATGVLVTSAPGAAQPALTGDYPIGTVQRFTDAAASIAVIHVSPYVPIPPAA